MSVMHRVSLFVFDDIVNTCSCIFRHPDLGPIVIYHLRGTIHL